MRFGAIQIYCEVTVIISQMNDPNLLIGMDYAIFFGEFYSKYAIIMVHKCHNVD